MKITKKSYVVISSLFLMAGGTPSGGAEEGVVLLSHSFDDPHIGDILGLADPCAWAHDQ